MIVISVSTSYCGCGWYKVYVWNNLLFCYWNIIEMWKLNLKETIKKKKPVHIFLFVICLEIINFMCLFLLWEGFVIIYQEIYTSKNPLKCAYGYVVLKFP